MGGNVEIKARSRHFNKQALGIRAVVRKKRTVYFCEQTRIHLDEVDGLGAFIELEVVLDTGQDIQFGIAVAQDLMSRRRIEKDDLVASAYVDLNTLTRGANDD